MSASIRIKIMGGTDLDNAYEICAAISERLGGIAVETSFNGVEMFYHRQPRASWQEEYHRSVYGKNNEPNPTQKGHRK